MLPPPNVILYAVGFGLLVPAAVTVIALLLALRLGRGEPLAVGAGLAAGFVALAATEQIQWGFLRPEESWDWLPALALLAAAAAFAEQIGKPSHVIGWAGRLVVAALTAGLLVRAQSARQPVEPYWYAAVALAVVALWAVLDLAARRLPGGTLPALLALVALAAALLAELADLLTVAHLGGVAAGALGGWAVVAWRRPQPGVCRAGVPPLAVLLPGLLFVAYFNTFSEVPAASYFLLLAAPLLLGVTLLLPARGAPSLGRRLLPVAAALLPLAAGLALAARP